MSKAEYRDVHLSDEKPHKRKDRQNKTYNKKKNKTSNVFDIDDAESDNSSGNSPHNNIYIIIRKKRATLPLKVDW